MIGQLSRCSVTYATRARSTSATSWGVTTPAERVRRSSWLITPAEWTCSASRAPYSQTSSLGTHCLSRLVVELFPAAGAPVRYTSFGIERSRESSPEYSAWETRKREPTATKSCTYACVVRLRQALIRG